MKRFFYVLLLLQVSVFAETFALNNFHTNVFSKVEKKPVDITLSLIFEGRDVEVEQYKIIDSLNVVIGSYYAEDLVTSRGKEILKSTLITYVRKAYSLDIDVIYIKELMVKM
ncbi:MAG: flagellar basal body-associated FliL family protein, partial [Sulfurospirillaceae bacterium]|nr:flagellar basal body-associated FliL family protein [Sulfurospirillaceae bacterium]